MRLTVQMQFPLRTGLWQFYYLYNSKRVIALCCNFRTGVFQMCILVETRR